VRAIEVVGGNGFRVHWIVDGLGSRDVCLLLPTSSNFLFVMGVVEDCKSSEDVVDKNSGLVWSAGGRNVLP
jgi:hypothetical protein